MLKRFVGFNREDTPDREPALRDPDQILAYLEELSRLRSLVHLHIRAEPPLCLGARVELVNDQEPSFSLSFPHQVPRLEVGQEVELHFPLAGMRFRATVGYKGRGSYMQSVFRLPAMVQFADRRGALRTRIGARERASAALFENLCGGIAASGRLQNLSLEGLCLRVDRALQIQGDRRLQPSEELFFEGQQLQVVRILNLPHLPTLEGSGEVRFVTTTQGGQVLVGLRLLGLGTPDQRRLEQFMARRLPSFGRAFPMRRRRGACEDEPAVEEEAEEAHEATGEEEDPLAGFGLPAEAAIDLLDPDAPALPEENGIPPEDRLLRLRRRGKPYLVILPDDLDRSIFVCSLQVCGYSRAIEARTLVQGLELSKKTPVEAIFLDQRIGPLSGIEVAQRLRKMGRLEGIPVFLLLREPDVKTLLSAKAAGIRQVIKVPVDFDGELRGQLDQALGLVRR